MNTLPELLANDTLFAVTSAGALLGMYWGVQRKLDISKTEILIVSRYQLAQNNLDFQEMVYKYIVMYSFWRNNNWYRRVNSKALPLIVIFLENLLIYEASTWESVINAINPQTAAKSMFLLLLSILITFAFSGFGAVHSYSATNAVRKFIFIGENIWETELEDDGLESRLRNIGKKKN